jgi:rhodanese-related sulfurtransferase
MQVAAVAGKLREAGFDGVAVNATGTFQAGARTLDALIDALAAHHDAIRREVG